MSLLANLSAQTNLAPRTKVPSQAVSATVAFLMVVKKKLPPGQTEAPLAAGKKAPPIKLSVIPLVDIDVPYIFRKGGENNLITEAEVGLPDIVVPAGCSTMIVSMFKPKIDLIPGGIYRLTGLYYTTYRTEGNPPGTSMSATTLTLATDLSVPALMRAIPFQNRSIDLDRDVPQPDVNYEVDSTFRFLHVKLVGGRVVEDKPDQLTGRFAIENIKDPAVLRFTPYGSTAAINALTGGTNGDKVGDNAQLYMQQNVPTPDGGVESFLVLGRCKLYPHDLKRLQVDWMKMGPTVIPHFSGDLLATINREHSRNEDCERSDMLKGVVALSANFHPSMAETSRACGVKLSWANCVKLAPALAMANNLVHADFSREDIIWGDAVNLLHFTGDASEVEHGAAAGLVELYAVTNADFDPDDLPVGEDERVAFLNNPKLYRGTVRETAVFAMLPEGAEGRIHDFVSTARGCPSAATTRRLRPVVAKRLRVEEEEGEGEK